MLFSDTNEEWRPIPYWAAFLIQIGHSWPNASKQRRIALVSMPCDSAAAGLVGLGALIRDLEDRHANDVEGHYAALLRYAQQYLQSCRDCGLPECRPDVKHCGYISKASGRLRSTLFPRKTFTISRKTDFKKKQIVWEYPYAPGHEKNTIQFPSPEYAVNWHVEGDPVPQLQGRAGALPKETYLQIVEGAPIIPDNLISSYSGLCLAGRVSGEASTRAACQSIRFRESKGEYALTELLTIHGWSSPAISRMTFFNARTERLDRRTFAPALVVADGDACFLKVLSRPEFQQSDVIGIIHRTIERDRLEAVGNRLLDLRQWYVDDPEMRARIPAMPPGITASILMKKSV